MKNQKKDRRLRILWSSNSPWTKSGYANQTNEILYRLLKDGWPVACSCFYGLQGGIIEINGLRCYPVMDDPYGTDACYHHAKHWKADVVIPFQDSWPMNPDLLRQLPRYMPYVPVDSDPCPDIVLERMRFAYRIITYSEFGRKSLSDRGYYSTMIPHGVDTQVFKPMDKIETRKQFGIPEDALVFGMVAMNKDNPSRKSFQEVLEAFARFVKEHPKAKLFIHSLLEFPKGFPIAQYARFLKVDKFLHYLEPYDTVLTMDHDAVARLTNSFDVLLCPSNSEGFGLPIIEAQSCGVPVITNDFTSMPELIIPGKTGLLTKVAFKRYAPQLAYVGHPDINDLYDKMEQIVRMDRKKMGEEGRKYMIENYEIEKLVQEKWIPLLEEVQQDVYGGGEV